MENRDASIARGQEDPAGDLPAGTAHDVIEDGGQPEGTGAIRRYGPGGELLSQTIQGERSVDGPILKHEEARIPTMRQFPDDEVGRRLRDGREALIEIEGLDETA